MPENILILPLHLIDILNGYWTWNFELWIIFLHKLETDSFNFYIYCLYLYNKIYHIFCFLIIRTPISRKSCFRKIHTDSFYLLVNFFCIAEVFVYLNLKCSLKLLIWKSLISNSFSCSFIVSLPYHLLILWM